MICTKPFRNAVCFPIVIYGRDRQQQQSTTAIDKQIAFKRTPDQYENMMHLYKSLFVLNNVMCITVQLDVPTSSSVTRKSRALNRSFCKKNISLGNNSISGTRIPHIVHPSENGTILTYGKTTLARLKFGLKLTVNWPKQCDKTYYKMNDDWFSAVIGIYIILILFYHTRWAINSGAYSRGDEGVISPPMAFQFKCLFKVFRISNYILNWYKYIYTI